ncbi:sigma-54 interaction domain-containing protein [Peribacillus frigoritolerans]|uniref:sigma-54 interaction domain-containing protein n=1 Tax=Peribacillus frigoritolerans TaxID=450367 RepID=UPI002417FC5F|nr:sigma 54-interacting transcriptional regulator [Peribacillus frigoritolerans]MDG4850017.1 sigma 54-interacting transcriptional regulator [Peribacillus frigoritolerans]WHX69054.1 sigma 54-interacting transcriptional regulator [Peribacillus frigoritolerans]
MRGITQNQEFIQLFSENLTAVLGFDITILDRNGNRVSGTGSYQHQIGKPAPDGSLLRAVMKTGRPDMTYDVIKNESHCMSCKFFKECKETATIGYPIIKGSETLGVIGLMGFSTDQKEKMIENAESLKEFLQHLSLVVESQLISQNEGFQAQCNLYEDTLNANKVITFDTFISKNEDMKDMIRKAKRIVNSTANVLIRGGTGTGKEVLAKAIHYEGNRKNHPFIAVNCAAIPESLLESELFGYAGGAFTGANREGKAGKFELANNGSLFLDEIGDLPLSLQPKLLRVLQERQIERVGGNKLLPVNVRVLTATHRNLEEMVQNGTFREDLYYRINVIPLHTKLLKERREDIPFFLQYFICKYCSILNRPYLTMDPQVEQWLIQYDWPGNIRQLENGVEYMVNMTESDVIGFNDLPDYLRQYLAPVYTGGLSLDEMVAEYEKSIIQSFFLSTHARKDKEKVAEELKISLSTLYRKLERYNLKVL